MTARSPSVALHRFACATTAAAYFLLFAGGMVTSTGSGLAVPDWPLSYGQYFPAMIGGVFFEHGHRMIAGLVGLMTFALAGWLWTVGRRSLRRLAIVAAGGILLQALLGGITVLYRLPPEVSIAHACLGQAVFCVLLAAAQLTSPWYRDADHVLDAAAWRPGAALTGAVYLQLFFGALLRHTQKGLVWHILGAALVLTALFRMGTLPISPSAAKRALALPLTLLLAAVPLQLILGGASYMMRLKMGHFISAWAVLPTVHLALGAFILGASLTWTLRAHRLSA